MIWMKLWDLAMSPAKSGRVLGIGRPGTLPYLSMPLQWGQVAVLVESPFRGGTNSQLVRLPPKEHRQEALACQHLYPTTVRPAQRLQTTPYPPPSLFSYRCRRHQASFPQPWRCVTSKEELVGCYNNNNNNRASGWDQYITQEDGRLSWSGWWVTCIALVTLVTIYGLPVCWQSDPWPLDHESDTRPLRCHATIIITCIACFWCSSL